MNCSFGSISAFVNLLVLLFTHLDSMLYIIGCTLCDSQIIL